MDNSKLSSAEGKGKDTVKINMEDCHGLFTPSTVKNGKAEDLHKMNIRFFRYQRKTIDAVKARKVVMGFSTLVMLIILTLYCTTLLEMSGGLKMKNKCYPSKDSVGMTTEEHLGRMIMALAKYGKNSDDEIKIINHFSNPDFKIPIHTLNNINFYVIGNYSTIGCTPKFCQGPDEVLDRVFSGIETDTCEKIQLQAGNALRNSEVPSVLKGYIFAVEKLNKENEETVCNLLAKIIRRLRIFYDLEPQKQSDEGHAVSPTANSNVEVTSPTGIEQTSSQNPASVEPSTESVNVVKPLKEKTDQEKGIANGDSTNYQPSIGFSIQGAVPMDREKVRKLSLLFAEIIQISGGMSVIDQLTPAEITTKNPIDERSTMITETTDKMKLTPMTDQDSPMSDQRAVDTKVELNTQGGIGELNNTKITKADHTLYTSQGLTSTGGPMILTIE